MIDIHTHLIPGVDDGPKTIEEAITLSEMCVQNGVTHAICTPHILAGRYENTINTLIGPMKVLQDALAERNIPLKLALSAEVRLDFSVLHLLENKEIPLIKSNDDEGNQYMLLELPDSQIPLGSLKLAEKLIEQNITPIIVHPERNKQIMRDINSLYPFIGIGCKFQITAASLLGQFGSVVSQAAWQLIDSDGVIAIASDCHNLKGRKPKMGEARLAVAERLGNRVAEHLTLLSQSKLFNEFNIVNYG